MKPQNLRWVFGILLGITATPAVAFPPPPPPPYVMDIGKIVSGQINDATIDRYAVILAPDLKVFENGKMIADGKEAWLKQVRQDIPNAWRRVFGWSPEVDNVLMMEQYDSLGLYYAHQKDMFVDPRRLYRTVRYGIGKDKLVHEIHILWGGYVWIETPNEAP